MTMASPPVEPSDHSTLTSPAASPAASPAPTDKDAHHSLVPAISPCASSSSSSGLHSLQPTCFAPHKDREEEGPDTSAAATADAPAKLALRRKPCVVTWSREQSHEGGGEAVDKATRDQRGLNRHRTAILTSSGLACDILFDGSTRSALVKLRIPVLLEKENGAPKPDAVFLIIPGETIMSLNQGGSMEDEGVIEEVTNALRHPSLCIDFSLRSKPVLVVPLRGIIRASSGCNVLFLLHSLAARTIFRVHISQRSIPTDQQRLLPEFCRAASTQCLASSPTFPLGNTIRSLYNGRGGRIVEDTSLSLMWICNSQDSPTRDKVADGDSAALPGASSSPSSPPPYDDFCDTQPKSSAVSNHVIPKAKKRRRSSGRYEFTELPAGDLAKSTSPPLVDGSLAHLKAELRQDLQRDIISHLNDMEKRLHRYIEDRSAAQRTAFHEDLHEQVCRLEQRMTQSLDDSCDRLRKDLDHREQEIECANEEQLLSCKAELEDYFKDERSEIDEAIEERLRDLEQSLLASVQDELADAKASLTRQFSSASAVLTFATD